MRSFFEMLLAALVVVVALAATVQAGPMVELAKGPEKSIVTPTERFAISSSRPNEKWEDS